MEEENAVIAERFLNKFNNGFRLSGSTGQSQSWCLSNQEAFNPPSWESFDSPRIQELIVPFKKAINNLYLDQDETRCTTSMTGVYIHMITDYFLLNKNYIIENEDQVFSFLNDHEHLVAFLIEAASQIQSLFGPVPLKLRMRQDSELPEDLSLIGEIIIDLTVDDALSKLDEFDRRWFLDNARSTEGKVQFDVEWC